MVRPLPEQPEVGSASRKEVPSWNRRRSESTALVTQARAFLLEQGLPIRAGRPALQRALPSVPRRKYVDIISRPPSSLLQEGGADAGAGTTEGKARGVAERAGDAPPLDASPQDGARPRLASRCRAAMRHRAVQRTGCRGSGRD